MDPAGKITLSNYVFSTEYRSPFSRCWWKKWQRLIHSPKIYLWLCPTGDFLWNMFSPAYQLPRKSETNCQPMEKEAGSNFLEDRWLSSTTNPSPSSHFGVTGRWEGGGGGRPPIWKQTHGECPAAAREQPFPSIWPFTTWIGSQSTLSTRLPLISTSLHISTDLPSDFTIPSE